MPQVGHRVADLDVGRDLDVRDEIPDVARLKSLLRKHLRREDADFLHLVARVIIYQFDPLPRLDLSRENPDVGDYTSVDIEDAIEDEPAQNLVLRFGRRRDPSDDGLENFFDADSHLGAG